ncbi:rod shape-determining protein MreD [Candidatus Pelagibacter sp.]|nr:rod shape-determining protein MreD [Candidatus Pelagibacter sp.]
MSSLNKNTFFKISLLYLPVTILFFSVFNEFDLNYLKIEYFSFDFVYILIFYWTLKNPNLLGYVSIFFAGIINDIVTGLPMGVSSLSYLLICVATAYIRNITLRPHFIQDWISFLITILVINSFQILILDFIFLFKLDYTIYFLSLGFTFILYPLFFFMFNFINPKKIIKEND